MDYIFYRIYTYYKKKDYIPVMMGIYFLFVLEFTILFFLAVMFNFLTNGLFSNQHMRKDMFWLVFGGVLVLLFAFNVFRYVKRNKLESILKQFEKSPLNKKIKMWQIFSMPILVIILSVILIVLFTRV
ncbi:MAG: hypothetical protein ACK4M1_12465 [Flavobacterium sp.]